MNKIFQPIRAPKMPDEQQLHRQIALDLQQIRWLARQIETPEQFERILTGIPDPETRQHIRALLQPLVPFPVPETHGEPEPDAAADAARAGGVRDSSERDESR